MEHVELELPDLLLGRLADTDRERIERHLEVCPSCRESWDSIAILADPNMTKVPPVPENYFGTLPGRILARRHSPHPSKTAHLLMNAGRQLFPVLAGALIVFVLVRLSDSKLESPMRLPLAPTEAAEYLASSVSFNSSDLWPAVEPLIMDVRVLTSDQFADETGLEDLEPQTVTEVVADLNDAEIDQLVSRLSEREIL